MVIKLFQGWHETVALCIPLPCCCQWSDIWCKPCHTILRRTRRLPIRCLTTSSSPRCVCVCVAPVNWADCTALQCSAGMRQSTAAVAGCVGCWNGTSVVRAICRRQIAPSHHSLANAVESRIAPSQHHRTTPAAESPPADHIICICFLHHAVYF